MRGNRDCIHEYLEMVLASMIWFDLISYTGKFFYLIQSEFGDLYKITIDFNANKVHDLTVKYFDTIPTATTLHITKHGMLLATSEVGDQ